MFRRKKHKKFCSSFLVGHFSSVYCTCHGRNNFHDHRGVTGLIFRNSKWLPERQAELYFLNFLQKNQPKIMKTISTNRKTNDWICRVFLKNICNSWHCPFELILVRYAEKVDMLLKCLFFLPKYTMPDKICLAIPICSAKGKGMLENITISQFVVCHSYIVKKNSHIFTSFWF